MYICIYVYIIQLAKKCDDQAFMVFSTRIAISSGNVPSLSSAVNSACTRDLVSGLLL